MHYVDRINAIAQRLLTEGVAERLLGCSEGEIGRLQSRVSFPLPDAYLHVLRRVGVSAGSFMDGSEFYVGDWDHARASAASLFADLRLALEVGRDCWPVMARGGYLAYLITTADLSEDAELVACNDDGLSDERIRISAWFEACVNEEVEHHRRLKGR
jgi:hypothetical protein